MSIFRVTKIFPNSVSDEKIIHKYSPKFRGFDIENSLNPLVEIRSHP